MLDLFFHLCLFACFCLSLLLYACLGMYSWSLPVLTGPYWSFTKTISPMCHRYMQLLQHSIHPSNEPLGSVVTGSLNLNFGSGCHIFQKQNSCLYISTLTGSIIAIRDHTHIMIFSSLVLLSDFKLLFCEFRLISLFFHL